MEKLPIWIYFNGKTYYLYEEILGEPIEGWYSFTYRETENSIPPSVKDGRGGYYLCTCDPNREIAYNDMLDRINKMKPWL